METKEEEFALAVEQSLDAVASEIQGEKFRTTSICLKQMVDSVGKPNRANFTDIFLFMDEDKSSNLSTFYSYGILEQDYNISINPPSDDPDLNVYDSTQYRDYKQVKTATVINKINTDNFNRENIRSSSIQKIREVDRIQKPGFGALQRRYPCVCQYIAHPQTRQRSGNSGTLGARTS